MKAIELKDISFRYSEDAPYVLEHADMCLEYGKLTLLKGVSGSGKSTILSILCGVIPGVTVGDLGGDVAFYEYNQHPGEIIAESAEGESFIDKDISHICRRVGIVLQNADQQIIHRTVEDEIAFGCENFAMPKDDITVCIDRSCSMMNLQKEWECRKLSGGQKQRLITACTLATGQRILLLDEPLANLDKEGAELLMRTLKELCGKGYAVLIAEHRIDKVMPYVDDVLYVSERKICRENVMKTTKDAEIQITPERKKSASTVRTAPADRSKPTTISTPADQVPFSHNIDNSDKGYRLPEGENGITSDIQLLQLKDVSYTVSGRTIIDHLDLGIEKGERVLLLGENGSGKSTILRLLAGLIKPTEGQLVQTVGRGLLLRGKPSRAWFKKVAFVYQNPDYQLFMPSVRAEVEYGAADQAYAEYILELFNLKELEERHPQSLSEGQKRRLSIAAALSTRPEVILLDEPTVGQDMEGLKRLIEALDTIRRDISATMVTITHDVRCARKLCDHAYFIDKGKMAAEGDDHFAEHYLLDI